MGSGKECVRAPGRPAEFVWPSAAGWVRWGRTIMEMTSLAAELLARATQGDVEAQYELGWRHALGMELPEDEGEALKWLRVAAGNGHALARNNLGARYLAGDGVEADPVEAYCWFHLAAEAGDRKAGKNRDTVAAGLTPEQIAEAIRRAAGVGAG